jgi:hypothetical protein
MAISDNFRIVIRSPLPEGLRLSYIDLNPQVSALSWETQVGGFYTCNVGYKIEGQPTYISGLKYPIEVPDLATAQVYHGSEDGFCCSEGRVIETNSILSTNVSAFQASGFGTSDGAGGDTWFYVPPAANDQQTIEDISRSAVNLLQRMVPSVTDILTINGNDPTIQDPGGKYTPRQEAGRYLGQAIDEIIKAGVQGGQEVAYYVYEDRRIQLKIIEPPLDDNGIFAPDWRVTPDKTVKVKRSGRKLIGACAVQFTPPGDAQKTTDVALVTGWSDLYGGLFRSMLIPPSNIPELQATMVRDRYLRRYSVPVITGSIEINGYDGAIRGRYGQPCPFFMPRYGQWLQIGKDPFFITKTKTNASPGAGKPGQTIVEFVNVPLSVGEV